MSGPSDHGPQVKAGSEEECIQVEGKTPAEANIKVHIGRRTDIPPGRDPVVFGEIRFDDCLADRLERLR